MSDALREKKMRGAPAVARLSPQLRAVVHLALVEDQPNVEIACAFAPHRLRTG